MVFPVAVAYGPRTGAPSVCLSHVAGLDRLFGSEALHLLSLARCGRWRSLRLVAAPRVGSVLKGALGWASTLLVGVGLPSAGVASFLSLPSLHWLSVAFRRRRFFDSWRLFAFLALVAFRWLPWFLSLVFVGCALPAPPTRLWVWS